MSANRIAAELGMSPGNLYYHFSDKNAIIRGLLSELIDVYDQLWSSGGGTPTSEQSLATLREILVATANLAWRRYRFFGREMVALLRADPELAQSYTAAYRRRLGEWSAFAERLVEHGLLRMPESPEDFTVAIWLIGESWITFLDITGDPSDPVQVARLADLVIAVLDPYLTPKGRRLWKTEAKT